MTSFSVKNQFLSKGWPKSQPKSQLFNLSSFSWKLIENYLMAIMQKKEMKKQYILAEKQALSWLKIQISIFYLFDTLTKNHVSTRYLDVLYSSQNIFLRIYKQLHEFYWSDRKGHSITQYFVMFKRTYEELNAFLHIQRMFSKFNFRENNWL